MSEVFKTASVVMFGTNVCHRGGLAVGTVILIEEDLYGNYARLMMKYFCAEAIMTQQSLLLCGTESQQLIKELPAQADDARSKDVNHEKAVSSSEKMKIAWRYEDKPKVTTSSTVYSSFGHYFDLTKTMEEELISNADITLSTTPLEAEEAVYKSPLPTMNFRYCHLLQDIRNKVSSGGFSISSEEKKRNILRIGIHSLGSPLLEEDSGAQNYNPSLALFLIALRALLRSSFAVAFITIPSHLFEEKCHLQRIESLCDTVVKLESFAGSEKEKNPVFKEYHGLFHVIHLPRINSIVPSQRDTSDLAFKLRRKKFSIEKLHLPPELADSTGRSQDEDHPLFSKQSKSGCGSGTSSKLDF